MSLRWYHYAAAGAGLAAGGYAAGRFSAPDKIKTVDRVVTTTVEDARAKEQVRLLTEQLETLKRNVHRERVTVAHPDGTRETKVTTDIHTDSSKDTKEATAIAEQSTIKVDATQSATHFQSVEKIRTAWRVGALVGPGPIIGAHVEHRFVGPVFLGGWLIFSRLHNSQYGLGVSVEF